MQDELATSDLVSQFERTASSSCNIDEFTFIVGQIPVDVLKFRVVLHFFRRQLFTDLFSNLMMVFLIKVR
ncbi:hypothetical protein KC329_g48 [Hortaea werneckii]|nr:hypothetical protein KC329_g48 [Hortaea werneckii]